MDQARIDALVSKGFDKAAQRVGSTTTQYRPTQLQNPMTTPYGTIMAAISRDASFGMTQPQTWARPQGIGLFTTQDVETGDILVNNEDTFFVSRKEAFRPAIVVLCNRIVSLFGSFASQTTPGQNENSSACPLAGAQTEYGTSFTGNSAPVAQGWPCSILLAGRGDRSSSAIPDASRAATYQLLLPQLPGGVVPVPYDTVADDIGNRYRIDSVEQSAHGIRCAIHLAQV